MVIVLIFAILGMILSRESEGCTKVARYANVVICEKEGDIIALARDGQRWKLNHAIFKRVHVYHNVIEWWEFCNETYTEYLLPTKTGQTEVYAYVIPTSYVSCTGA